MMYDYLLESKNQDTNNEIRKYITDKYPWYFIHIYTLENGIKTVLSKTTTKIDIIGFKEKIDPKYKKFSLGAIVNNNKDKCKVLLSDYTVKGNFTIDKDLKKYTSFNSIFISSKKSVNEQVLIESVEEQITSAGSKEGLMKKFNLANKDIEVGKNFLRKNPKIADKFKACKSIKDFMMVMKDKEVKDAMNNDK